MPARRLRRDRLRRLQPGPTNQKLVDRVKASVEQFRKDNPDYQGPIPADLVTASASGLDPHISPDSARAQVPELPKPVAFPQARQIDWLPNSPKVPIWVCWESRGSTF